MFIVSATEDCPLKRKIYKAIVQYSFIAYKVGNGILFRKTKNRLIKHQHFLITLIGQYICKVTGVPHLYWESEKLANNRCLIVIQPKEE